MANNEQPPPQSPLLPEAEEEVDVLFKAQMWVYDQVMTWWKHGVALVALVLIGTLVYGTVDNYLTDEVKAGSAAIAAAERKLPEIDQLAQYGLAPMDDPADTERMKLLREAAEEFETAAKATRGASTAEAWLKAADTWLRVGDKERATKAFEAAREARATGVFGFAAANGLASLALGEGRAADAVSGYRAFADADRGFFGEQALIKLARLHADQGDDAAARGVVEELRTRYPESPRVNELASSLGVTLTPAPAPAG